MAQKLIDNIPYGLESLNLSHNRQIGIEHEGRAIGYLAKQILDDP